jgi:hypothetical protein
VIGWGFVWLKDEITADESLALSYSLTKNNKHLGEGGTQALVKYIVHTI